MSGVGKINAIQGLSGIAALLVVPDHSFLRFSKGATHKRCRTTTCSMSLKCWGVESFFTAEKETDAPGPETEIVVCKRLS